MRYGLSKSKIAAFEQCSKRLWLSVHKADEMVVSEATQAVFAAGHEVGAVACSLVPEGIMIEAEPDMRPINVELNSVILAACDWPVLRARLSKRARTDAPTSFTSLAIEAERLEIGLDDLPLLHFSGNVVNLCWGGFSGPQGFLQPFDGDVRPHLRSILE